MEDFELETWWDGNKEELTISFLGWIADQEQSAQDGTKKHKLWELGSKLMALREGFAPISSAQLNETLQNAPEIPDDDSNNNTFLIQQHISSPGSFAAAVKQSSLLGLSSEGMALLEQQAAALEAAMGTTRAQALTEIIGRAKLSTPQQQHAASNIHRDGTSRILEVLVQVEDREERAAMLPDAFTPPLVYLSDEARDGGDGVDDPDDGTLIAEDDGENQEGSDSEEEMVYTTPWQLLQCVNLWLNRIDSTESPSSLSSSTQTTEAIASWGGILHYESDTNDGSSSDIFMLEGDAYRIDQLQRRLLELREDIMNDWDVFSSEEDF